MSDLPQPPDCLFCAGAPPLNPYGLCQPCWSMEGVRQLYRRRKGWNPVWEMHLRQLAGQTPAKRRRRRHCQGGAR